jgi:preprotein translocase subunit SecY
MSCTTLKKIIAFGIILVVVFIMVEIWLYAIDAANLPSEVREAAVVLMAALVGSMIYDAFKAGIYDAYDGKWKLFDC